MSLLFIRATDEREKLGQSKVDVLRQRISTGSDLFPLGGWQATNGSQEKVSGNSLAVHDSLSC